MSTPSIVNPIAAVIAAQVEFAAAQAEFDELQAEFVAAQIAEAHAEFAAAQAAFDETKVTATVMAAYYRLSSLMH